LSLDFIVLLHATSSALPLLALMQYSAQLLSAAVAPGISDGAST